MFPNLLDPEDLVQKSLAAAVAAAVKKVVLLKDGMSHELSIMYGLVKSDCMCMRPTRYTKPSRPWCTGKLLTGRVPRH